MNAFFSDVGGFFWTVIAEPTSPTAHTLIFFSSLLLNSNGIQVPTFE